MPGSPICPHSNSLLVQMGRKHIQGRLEAHSSSFSQRSSISGVRKEAVQESVGTGLEQNSAPPPPLQRMSLDVRRVCCVNTCLTSGAAHAQCADTPKPFVVSCRSARKHVNVRAAFSCTPGHATLTAVPVCCRFIAGRSSCVRRFFMFLSNQLCSAHVLESFSSCLFFPGPLH